MLIAHKDSLGNKQLLIEHSLNVACGCYKLGEDLGIRYMALIIGLLHDIGKADSYFQDMIQGKTKDKVVHSSAGAKYIFNIFKNLCIKDNKYRNLVFLSYIEILMYVIESHHGVFDVIDFGKEYPNNIYSRIKYDNRNSNYNYSDVEKFSETIEKEVIEEYGFNLEELILQGYIEYQNIYKKLGETNLNPKKNEFHFYNHCLIRLLLSILKNEDIFDTINAYNPIIQKTSLSTKNQMINFYYQMIEEEYASYPTPTSNINKVRSDISNQIRTRYDSDTNGIYRLDLPTGAGKTKVSLLYSLHQMKNNNRKRMFYIAPYLSILEQNAQEIKKTLKNDKYILEHHSNISENPNQTSSYDDTDSKDAIKEYIKDTWDQLIVLSSMVQFTNTLFKSKSANIRRFYNLSQSVIVLDEVHSLPAELTHVFNLMLNFISKVMNSNIILCSATQPSLDHSYLKYKLSYGGSLGEDANLITLDDQQEDIFKRTIVNIVNSGRSSSVEDIYLRVKEKFDKSTLIILNTKSSVEKLYNLFKSEGYIDDNLYYLTTNMCPKHRLDIIEEIRLKLKDDKPIILISTSLIEAGIDLDFNILYRSFAGIDSIVQAMGRCNREGKLLYGQVNLININNKEENLDMLPSIKQRKQIAEQLLKDKEGFDINILNYAYFSKLYANSNNLDFKLDNGHDLLDILSINKEARSTMDLKGINFQAIKEASNKFNLIDNKTIPVIVYYKESALLIEELIKVIREFDNFKGDIDKIKDIKYLLKQLQPYTINIYSTRDIDDKLINIEGFENFDIKILNESNYDENVGLSKESSLDTFVI